MAFNKKEDVFFTLFKDFSTALSAMGNDFSQIIKTYPTVENAAEKMKEYESSCDDKKHTIIHKLNDSFVTPFDREDLFTMAGQLDDLADYMEDIICKLDICNIISMRREAIELGEILVEITHQVNDLFHALPDSKHNRDAVDAVIRINGLEDKADYVYRQALRKLFHEEQDPIEILKWREIYKLLEDAIDSGEHLADTVEGILTKNA